MLQRSFAQSFGGGHGVGVRALAGLGGVHTHAHAHLVVTAVVAALDLGDLALASDGTRRPYGVQRGLGSRVGEPYQVEAGDTLAEQLGQPDLMGVGSVVDHAVLHLILDRVQHRLGSMPQD